MESIFLVFLTQCIITGYIVTKLLLTYGDTQKIHDVMVETAWVAQWQPLGKCKYTFDINES